MKQIMTMVSDRDGFFSGMIKGATASTGLIALLLILTAIVG